MVSIIRKSDICDKDNEIRYDKKIRRSIFYKEKGTATVGWSDGRMVSFKYTTPSESKYKLFIYIYNIIYYYIDKLPNSSVGAKKKLTIRLSDHTL